MNSKANKVFVIKYNSFATREKSPVVFLCPEGGGFHDSVLYPPNAADFSSFGLGVLTDTNSCEVTEERKHQFAVPADGVDVLFL